MATAEFTVTIANRDGEVIDQYVIESFVVPGDGTQGELVINDLAAEIRAGIATQKES